MRLRILVIGVCIGCWCVARVWAAAAPPLSIQHLPGSQLQITWPGDAAGFTLEQTESLIAPLTWQAVGASVENHNAFFAVTIPIATQTRFYRLRRSVALPATILETSPVAGESGVAVTRESIFRFSAPLAADAVLDTDSFFAECGGRLLLARPELSSDRRTATLFYLEHLPASARVRVTLRAAALRDTAGKLLDADGDGEPGGTRVLEFDTAGRTGLPGTAVIGTVFASEKSADGSNKPLANVTITVDGAEESLRTTTDASGAFTLSPAPAGRFFVHVDGRTAVGSRWPDGAYYPFVGKAWEAVAGKTNNLAGGSGELFLPLVPSDALRTVSATEETTVTFSPSAIAADPALAGVEIIVPPNALFSDSGVRGGRLGMAPVPPDRLPEPLPPGLNLPLVITIQTDGASNFDVPAPVKFPNLPDPVTGAKLGPGEKTVLWSFNHDTGRWEPQGTMTISADGRLAVTDAGVGVRQPGWHGAAPGTRGDGPELCQGDDCNGPKCGAYPPSCCASWEDFKKPCELKQEQALTAISDLAIDNALFALGGPGGCGLGLATGTMKVARDCVKVGQFSDACGGIVTDGIIGGILGCIPGVVGGTAGLAWGGKSVIDGAFGYQDCLDTLVAACGGVGPQSLMGSSGRHDPRLERALAALELQIRLAQGLREGLRRILGNSRWTSADSPEAFRIHQDFMKAIDSGLRPASPGGAALTSAERAAVLALPRPNGASLDEATDLMDRLEGIATGSLKSDTNLRSEVAAGFDSMIAAMDEAMARGWTDLLDGFRIAMAEFSSMSTPGNYLAGGATVVSAVQTLGRDSVNAGTVERLFVHGPLHYLLRDLSNGFEFRGQLSSAGRFEGVFLRPNAYYAIGYVDPVSLRQGVAVFRASAAGDVTKIPSAPLRRASSGIDPDTDQDGLGDRAELILGTNPAKPDSDGDGIADGRELIAGTNPLDGTPAVLGLVAGADTPGTALAVCALGNHAFVADGPKGLAVLELKGLDDPILVAQLAIPGNPHAIAGAEQRVVLGGDNELTIVNVADPAVPTLVAQLPLSRRVNAVAVRGGQVAAALMNGDLLFVDAATGVEQQRISSLDTTLHDLQFSGQHLYALSGDELVALERTDGLWLPVGRIAVAGTSAPLEVGRKLAVRGDIAWVGYFTGFSTVNLSDPAAMRILGTPPQTQAAIHDFALAGSGNLAAVTSFGGTGSLAVSLYDVRDAAVVTGFLASFETGGEERALVVHRGALLVAASRSGLQIVNFIPPDFGSVAPSVTLTPQYPGALPRAEFDALLPVTVNAADDVGVQSLELEVDGQVVDEEGGSPFTASVRVPGKSSGRSSLTLRARAIDLAGQFTWTPALVVPLVDDATPPMISLIEPAPDSAIVAGALREVRVKFEEAIASAVGAETLSLVHAGTDQEPGTADDVPVTGAVRYDAADQAIVLTTGTVLLAGRYQATLVAGLADAAGNHRLKPFVWRFETGPEPHIVTLFPPANYVQVGGTLTELVFTFDQPVPGILADTYAWKVTHRTFPGADGGAFGPATLIQPLQVSRSADGKTFTLRNGGTFPPGQYRVTGSGPNVQAMLWDFHFRDVPNEATGTSQTGSGLVTNWRYFPGPGVGDELHINLPGQVAPIESRDIRALVAYSDIRFSQQTIQVPGEIRALAGLEIVNCRFGPGSTEVRGPLTILGTAGSDVGPHVINAYGGGLLRNVSISFSDPNGALVNHPGSTLILSNGTSVANTGVARSDIGRIVNLGTLRSSPSASPLPTLELEDVRVRNDGLIDVASGSLKFSSLESEGVIQVGAGARVILAEHTRGGLSSRITGVGTLEFGEYDTGTQRIVGFADAEWKGEVDASVAFTLVAGTVTLWKPLVRPAGSVELRNGSLLKLLGPAHLGTVTLTDGDLAFNSDSQIDHIDFGFTAQLRSETLVRITGNARIGLRLETAGQGIVEFAGRTIVSNGTQVANAQIGHASIRNTGTWQQSGGGSSGTGLVVRQEDGGPGRGVFENLGLFEQTTDRVLNVTVPFRNLGQAVFSRGPVVFDGRVASERFGSYLHGPAAELVLNNTDFQHDQAGPIDFTGGLVRGTGTIRAVDGTTRPKVTNRAVLRPGNPVGALTIRATGGFEQTSTGEIAVTLAGTDHSRLSLTSTAATLAGTLRVEFADGFSPVLGQTFNVMTFTSRVGEFDRVVLPDLGAGRKLEAVYSATAVTLRVAASP